MGESLRCSLAILLVALLVSSTAAKAAILVRAAVTPLVGKFRYDFEVENTGPDDHVIVSIVDAPLADVLIPPSLTAPTGFLASYDPGLGIVDFLEDTGLFAAGTTVGLFTFESTTGPNSGFGAFEALSVAGVLTMGSVESTVLPAPTATPTPTTKSWVSRLSRLSFGCLDFLDFLLGNHRSDRKRFDSSGETWLGYRTN